MTPTAHVMQLLAAGIPLSLLCDLADPDGPRSTAILLDEPAAALDAVRAACLDLAEGRRAAGA